MSDFASLGLRAELLRALADAGYESPTPIQAQAIPPVLAGRDVLAAAQTGTGKTAGFTLPILQRLAEVKPATAASSGRRPIRVLILTPTRELAAQVEESVRDYGKYLPQVRSAVIFGGVGMRPQIDALQRGVDILVATPGRLLDHAQQRTVDLSQVSILVLDEADRMLDMGFIRDIRRVLALLPANRQNLLFSATFSNEIRELANGILKEPVPVEVARRNQESELVTQAVYACPQPHKRHLLAHLLRERGAGQAIVFTRTKHGADRLAKQLVQTGIGAVAIHGNRSQGQRTRALADFKGGTARVLVATDIAARGLDIEQLPHVFNYELPNIPEDYVHRIGRTGRAGSPGEAVSLVSPDEEAYLASIERLIKKKVERRKPVGFTPPAASEVAASAAADAVDDAERRQRAIASRAGQRRAMQTRQQTAAPGGYASGGGSHYPQPAPHQRPRPAAQPTHGPAQHAPRRQPQPNAPAANPGGPSRRGGWSGR